MMRDGTILTAAEGIGRFTVDGTFERVWLPIVGANDLALDAAEETLFVTSTDPGEVLAIDLTATPPQSTVLVGGSCAWSVAVGPDGYVYLGGCGSENGGQIHRVAPTGGVPTLVNSEPLPGGAEIWDMMFDSEGRLVVAAYDAIVRLTLAEGVEASREELGVLFNPFGIELDANGNVWSAWHNLGEGGVRRLEVDTGTVVEVERGTQWDGANGLAFGIGPLRCDDLYVLRGGLTRLESVGVTGAR